jgi:hypothetical protein
MILPHIKTLPKVASPSSRCFLIVAGSVTTGETWAARIVGGPRPLFQAKPIDRMTASSVLLRSLAHFLFQLVLALV